MESILMERGGKEDNMAFGKPTRYWQLDVKKVCAITWDIAVHEASEEYKQRMHNLCCDNCHSFVALALNLMRYDNCTSWNMINLCLLSFIHGKHVSCVGFLKTWLPFLLLIGVILAISLGLNLRLLLLHLSGYHLPAINPGTLFIQGGALRELNLSRGLWDPPASTDLAHSLNHSAL
ncbi:hypothetical protein JZ751_024049, partial [Albula glossodonta]